MKRDRSEYLDTWAGGYVRRDSRGRRVYVIRREIHGARFHVSTRAHTESAALAQWERFQRNPTAYRPAGDDGAPLYLTGDLVAEYMAWSASKGNSRGWLAAKAYLLDWWQTALEGRDLRRVDVRRDILPALEGVGTRSHRVTTLKHLYAWLRTERFLLTPQEDPTYGVLRAPQSDPRTRRIADKSIPLADYRAVRRHLRGHWRDALDVLAGTGVHVTALARFANRGTFEPYRRGIETGEPYVKGSETVAGVLVFPQEKHGSEHRVGVSAPALKAAQHLRARGSLDRGKFDEAVAEACAAAGRPRLHPRPHAPRRGQLGDRSGRRSGPRGGIPGAPGPADDAPFLRDALGPASRQNLPVAGLARGGPRADQTAP